MVVNNKWVWVSPHKPQKNLSSVMWYYFWYNQQTYLLKDTLSNRILSKECVGWWFNNVCSFQWYQNKKTMPRPDTILKQRIPNQFHLSLLLQRRKVPEAVNWVTTSFSLSNATWKPICSNSLSPPVLHQVPLYLWT